MTSTPSLEEEIRSAAKDDDDSSCDSADEVLGRCSKIVGATRRGDKSSGINLFSAAKDDDNSSCDSADEVLGRGSKIVGATRRGDKSSGISLFSAAKDDDDSSCDSADDVERSSKSFGASVVRGRAPLASAASGPAGAGSGAPAPRPPAAVVRIPEPVRASLPVTVAAGGKIDQRIVPVTLEMLGMVNPRLAPIVVSFSLRTSAPATRPAFDPLADYDPVTAAEFAAVRAPASSGLLSGRVSMAVSASAAPGPASASAPAPEPRVSVVCGCLGGFGRSFKQGIKSLFSRKKEPIPARVVMVPTAPPVAPMAATAFLPSALAASVAPPALDEGMSNKVSNG